MDINQLEKYIEEVISKTESYVKVKLFYWEHFGFLIIGKFKLDKNAKIYIKS